MPLSGLRAIIVENNFAVARSLRFLLESYGCEIAGMVATSEEAVKLITQTPFDVALLDVQLATRNVASVASRIREQGGRIIYITGYEDLEMLPLELRSFPRLLKPVDPDLLLATILEMVGRPTT